MQRFLSLPEPMVVILSLALVLVIGFLDFITGRDFALSAFYLMPICWIAWAVGRRAGLITSVLGAITWFTADSLSGFIYPHPLLPLWNALMLFVLFVAVVYSLTAFHEAHRSLAETVEERTNALCALEAEIQERKRLEVAKLQSERLAVVGKMAAQVAHEVRNPLGSIALNLDLIHKEIDNLASGFGHSPGEGRTLVSEMRAEVCRISRVIEDYLQFARLPKLQLLPLDLHEFLEQKLGFLGAELEKMNIKLLTRFDPAQTWINAGADQLWQAMLNLIRNSCEAMPAGGELTINSECRNSHVLLRIIDNGKGMTEEQRQQVFAPFFTTKDEGVGLGMALVHQIITEHKGRIECESVSGAGSTFTIYLPLAKKD